MPHKYLGERYVVQASWDQAAHLSDDAKKSLYASIPEYQRQARSEGIPQLGAGAIYPIDEKLIKVDPFAIPRTWPRAYGMDVGLRTGAVWGAKDVDSQTVYLYREYYREGLEPSFHAAAIKGHNDIDSWIPGVIDPAARGRTSIDGRRLIDMYRNLGLNVIESENAVDAGIQEIWDAMVSGRLKVFSNLLRWFQEFRTYQRDQKGHVVKKRDELMDCSRYFWLSGRDRMCVRPNKNQAAPPPNFPVGSRSWMA